MDNYQNELRDVSPRILPTDFTSKGQLVESSFVTRWKLWSMTISLILAVFMVGSSLNTSGAGSLTCMIHRYPLTAPSSVRIHLSHHHSNMLTVESAIAVPTISTDFKSLKEAGWYGTSYQLAMTVVQLSSGRIYANFDLKMSFIAALFFFEGLSFYAPTKSTADELTVGSTICVTAVNSVMLIAGRAIAGAAASLLFTGGMLIIEDAIPLPKRPMYIAGISSMFGLSAVLGPILGGVLTQNLSWRWCFWINLPLGLATFLGVLPLRLSSTRNSRTKLRQKIKDIGLGSTSLLFAGIFCLILGLQYGGTTFNWQNGRIIGLFSCCAVLLSIFVVVQIYHGDNSLIPIRLLRQRTVVASSGFTFLLSMATFT